MLKLISRVILLIILGIAAYHIAQIGSFNKSQTSEFWREKRVFGKGGLFTGKAKKSYYEAQVWARKNIAVYYDQTCIYLKPCIRLGKDFFMVIKNNIISFFRHAEIYVVKNFPVFRDYMSVVLEGTISTAKEGAVAVSQLLQNYVENVVQYVNNMFSQR